MYEEEDDDLPTQYRRLTAHLQTNSADFNRRLSAYLTNQVAMRSAFGQSIINAYAQDYGHNPHFANAQPYFPSPMMTHQQQQQQPFMQQGMMQPPMQQPHSPSMHRQSPYPSPRPQQQGSQHNRAASIATPQQASGAFQSSPVIPPNNNERRASMPTVKTEIKEESPAENHGPFSASAATPGQRPSFPQGNFSQQNPYNQVPQSNYNMTPFRTYNPFSMALPMEAQMFLGSTLPSGPFTDAMMEGISNLPTPAFDFGSTLPQTTEFGKGQQIYPTTNGLNSTLSGGVDPSELDLNQGYQGGLDFSQDQSFFDQAINGDEVTPAGTPGIGGESWSNFIDTDSWEAPTASQ